MHGKLLRYGTGIPRIVALPPDGKPINSKPTVRVPRKVLFCWAIGEAAVKAWRLIVITIIVITYKKDMAGKLQQEIKQTKPFADRRAETFLNVQRTADFLMQGINGVLKPAALTPTQ